MRKRLNVKRFLLEMVFVMVAIGLLFINNNYATVQMNTYTVVEHYSVPRQVETAERYERVTWDLTPYVGVFFKLTSESGYITSLRVNYSSPVACAQVGDQIQIVSHTGLLFGLLKQELVPITFTCGTEVTL